MSSKTKTPTDTVIERDGFAEITLTRPRQVSGMETAVLRMREPTVEDMERYQDDKGSDAQREVRMIANLCEISPDDVRKMPLRDYARLQAGVALFTT
ncbi:phage tail assembly protein [Stenotrophomonas maltophilia]|uniref:Phage tail assembly protein n=1 Tax=Stenotrophomonas maltophilia TaxID=40324 RepID=A0AAI9FW73_STEMA|nr:phage tail assembly protein [Stenotrophomonas maltophilia]AWT13627.1 phage tail assembly protein [Stenotrophomonas maltophilia]EKT4093549.1 phage tail assembly protein [Stenotrophomonas maltophilia]EKT4095261.1 phage tail assembly protein [Stenotrophomonas maltophilia]MBA0360346.1 phage tail assembly protein [Stenotrophomonas maltophilia]HEL4101267.1 phage tail assembly protein [Stenotrophomonas maltophilia]